jgi:hypothetical protein
VAWGREISRATLVAVLALLALPVSSPAAGPPQIGASWVTDVTTTGADLWISLDPNGLNTGYRFEYISEAAYRANLEATPPREGFFGAAQVPAGKSEKKTSVPDDVSEHVGGLSPATAYRYRPVAKNSAGVTVGLVEHVFTTKDPSAPLGPLDGRAWEMVSPVDKNGGAIAAPESLFGGGDFQAAAGGGALTYGSATAFGAAVSAPPVSQYVSRRTGSGWSTENVSPPIESGAYGDRPDGAPYRVFSSDLSAALLFGGLACRGDLPGCPSPTPVLPGTGATDGYEAYYLRHPSGAFASLFTQSELSLSQVDGEHFEASFAAASPDLSHVILSTCAALTADATEVLSAAHECEPAQQNLYEWSGGGLALLNVLPGKSGGTPGAVIAAPIGAVSDDGSRVYFTELEDAALYLREAGGPTKLLPGTGSGVASFQTASTDGSIAFYTVGGELLRYHAVTEVSEPIASGVIGVLGASADGEYVYYLDGGGLRLWHASTVTTIAPGAGAAQASDYPPATGTSRVTADGRHLAFLSEAGLMGFDNLDTNTGDPDSEVYLYGPPPGGGTAELVCVSCASTRERPLGPSTIPGAPANGSTRPYKPRALSASGSRVFFDSPNALDGHDPNKVPDVYEWEARGEGDCTRSPGCVGLVSGGGSEGAASFVDASVDGTDVYFLTNESLVGADPGSIDLYDARVGGGFPEEPKPIPCIADACQVLPAEPEDPTPGTLLPNSGNPKRHFVKDKPHPRHPRRRHHNRRRHHGGRHRDAARGGGRGR